MMLRYYNYDDEVIGTVTVRDGKAVGTGAGAQEDGTLVVLEPGTLKKLSPADGDRWLTALAASMRGGHVRAELVDT